MSTLSLNGARVHVCDRGDGRPMVFVHGGLGVASEWDAIAAHLLGRHRVVTFDGRGHGRSTNPAATLSYPQLADDTAALIGALGLVAPIVVGWSDGGQVALELAVRHPGAVGALVVGGAYPEFEASGLRAVHEQLHHQLSQDTDPDLGELKALHDDWPALIGQSARMWTTYSGLAPAAVEAISAPALVLAADRDELVNLDLSLALAAQLPNAELAVIPGAEHETPFAAERAPLIATIIEDFARRHPITERST